MKVGSVNYFQSISHTEPWMASAKTEGFTVSVSTCYWMTRLNNLKMTEFIQMRAYTFCMHHKSDLTTVAVSTCSLCILNLHQIVNHRIKVWLSFFNQVTKGRTTYPWFQEVVLIVASNEHSYHGQPIVRAYSFRDFYIITIYID